tara:strand:- start:608 stop:784 length:177 start_codon:yes stop_codon:yes gene_type:complete
LKFKIFSVGKIKNKNLTALVRNFEKRISYDAKLELIEIKDSDPGTERNRILAHPLRLI